MEKAEREGRRNIAAEETSRESSDSDDSMGDIVSGRDVQTHENTDFDSINLGQGSMSQPDNVEASSSNRIEASRVNKEIQKSKTRGFNK